MGLLLVLAGAGASASAEQVGRVRFELADAGWRPLVSYERTLKFDSGLKQIPLKTTVFVLPGGGAVPKALLQVTSSEGGSGHSGVRWVSDKCPEPRARFYTNDHGANLTPDRRDCVIVNSAFAANAYFADAPEVLAALAEQKVQLFKGGYSMRSTAATGTGTFMRVNLMTASGFAGSDEPAPAGADLHEVPAPLVAWGESLHRAVRESVGSLSGDLTLPPITFQRAP